MKVLLSIKPEFVRSMIDGNKKYEFRKKIFRNKNIDVVVVYATKPVGKVVGEFKIKDVLKDTPTEIWKKTKNESGISKNFFYSYFNDKDSAYAIEFDEFQKYDYPMDLMDLDKSIKVAPQSFRYLY